MDRIRMTLLIVMLLFLAVLSSCFEEDDEVQPHIQGDELTYAYEESIYTTQSFFDLGNNEIVNSGLNSVWNIAFACGASNWHIIVNSADYWGIFRTGSRDMDASVTSTAIDEWRFDKSDGNPDSTAVGEWVKFEGSDTLYSNEVFVLGQYDGIGYTPMWKLRFIDVDRESYRFVFSPYHTMDSTEVIIVKDPQYNFKYYEFSDGGREVVHEPPREQWDLHFTQYGSIIYTDDGIPTPYFVRGVLLNQYEVMAALDSLNEFNDITYDSLSVYSFSKRQDLIGYEWKDVTVDVSSNTAVYQVKTQNNYIIRDTEGFYYKLRFISYYNDQGVKGYPVFEFAKL